MIRQKLSSMRPTWSVAVLPVICKYVLSDVRIPCRLLHLSVNSWWLTTGSCRSMECTDHASSWTQGNVYTLCHIVHG